MAMLNASTQRTLSLLLIILQLLLIIYVGASVPSQDDLVESEAFVCLVSQPAGISSPTALRRPSLLTTAAGQVLDEYHWLRDDSHSDPEVLGYITAENAYADAALGQLQPLAAKLAAEMEERLISSSDPVPVRNGRWWYYERQEPGQRFWRKYRRPAVLVQAAGVAADSSTITDTNKRANGPYAATRASSSQPAPHAGGALVWNEVGPDLTSAEQIVLDPDAECEKAFAGVSRTHGLYSTSSSSSSSDGSSSSSGPEHCDVYGSTVSPDAKLVAFGIDISGSEQYQLVVRDVDTGNSLLPNAIPATSGDYEWAAGSRALFYVTRDSATNRPSQVWYISLDRRHQHDSNTGHSLGIKPALLYQEDNPAFFLSLSRSSSGRFLLLSVASEVTRQMLLLDLQPAAAGRHPTGDDWLTPAPRRHGVKQQICGHWQSWLFLLVVSPETPNGELLVAPISAPEQHMVLLPHRREVELEDVRIFAHHLVLAERQLGHTTITVYCLPANSTAAAYTACKYNSTAASAAKAEAEAAAQKGSTAATLNTSSGPISQHGRLPGLSTHADSRSSGPAWNSGAAADVAILEAASAQQLDLVEALPLLDRSSARVRPDAHHQSGTFVVIRGRAGSIPEQDSSTMISLLDPSVAVEEQRIEQQQRQQQAVKASTKPKGAAPGKQMPKASKQQNSRTAPPAAKSTAQQPKAKPSVNKPGSSHDSNGSNKGKGSKASSGKSDASLHPPLLSSENSWQVAFEEDAYSVSILDSGDWTAPLLRLSYTSFTTPHTVVDIDMLTQRRVVRSVEPVGGGFRSSDYRSYRLWAAASDGVEVPLSVVYRLDTFGRDGHNPALLMVYGAYGTKYDPEWDSRLLSLLDRGWVVGIVHVRGGGELGYGWHAAGRLDAKTNSFSDLIAAATAMIQHNLTSASRLAVWGRSAGGLTAAGAINLAPSLFHAALLDVPFLDVLGDLVDAELPLTVKEWDEWGDPLRNATQAAAIASYSPVHNVVPGVRYPHMLVTAGLMDMRVGYWEAAKWVAQLRAAAALPIAHSEGGSSAADSKDSESAMARRSEHSNSQSDSHGSLDGTIEGGDYPAASDSSSTDSIVLDQLPGHHQLLLRTDMSGGHFSTGGTASCIDDAALKYAFLIATLPSCGSPLGLTGPDVQRPEQLQQQSSEETSTTNTVAAAALLHDSGRYNSVSRLMELLPTPVQRLLVGVVAMVVASGLLSVLWHASRVWWPLAVNPADYENALDLAAGSSFTPTNKLAGATKLKPAPGREVSRRVSTASTATAATLGVDRQQRLSVSVGESCPLLCAASSPGRHTPSSVRHIACLPCTPTTNVLQQQQQPQQHQTVVVFGGLIDDWLLELTSAVPESASSGSSRSAGYYQEPLLQSFASVPSSSSSHTIVHSYSVRESGGRVSRAERRSSSSGIV